MITKIVISLVSSNVTGEFQGKACNISLFQTSKYKARGKTRIFFSIIKVLINLKYSYNLRTLN